MPHNVFDKAARIAARIDPTAFLCWAMNRPREALEFREWLDSRNVPFPQGLDRTGDTVAHVGNLEALGIPWAIAIEFQLEPDPTMFGRLLVYLGELWLRLKPDPERGSRFNVGSIVVNLTGRGNASREFAWFEAGIVTDLRVKERNLELESAAALLGKIAKGVHPLSLLPWIPLMTGGDEQVIVDQWKQLAESEPDSRQRSTYAVLARFFAEAANRKEFWTESLKGWNMRQSTVAQEFIDEGRQEGIQKGRQEGKGELLEVQLTERFGSLPDSTLKTLRGMSEQQILTIAKQIFKAQSLAELGL